MRVALTGASGFIGAHTCRALHARGHSVRALVRGTSRRDHIAGVVAEFVEGDLGDPRAMEALVDGVEAVIHNGVDWSVIGGAEGEKNDAHFERNVAGSLKLLDRAYKAGAGQFLFVSSGAVNHEIVTSPMISEMHPTWPSSLYGAYKAAIEPFLKAYHHGHGMNTSSWRPVAVYGMAEEVGEGRWVDSIRAAAAGERVDKPGGGKITHVRDVADALALAVGDEGTAGQIYNLAERYLHWCEPALIAAELTGSGADVVDHRGGGPKNSYDTSKAVAFFDRHGHREGLRRGTNGVRDYVAEVLRQLG